MMNCLHCLAISLLVLLPHPAAWCQQSSYDPAAKQAAKQRDGFVDFTLKQINPQNTDHGCQIDEARKLIVNQTVKKIDSWATLIAFGFLVLSFFMLLHQHREGNRREIMASAFLAQYHNAWVDACKYAEQAIRRYNELVDTTSSAAEAAIRSQSPEMEFAQASMAKPNLGRDGKPQSASSSAERNSVRRNGAASTESVPAVSTTVRSNTESQIDLIAQISTLQQQLHASHEREKNLQRELSKANRRPQSQPSKSTNVAS